MLKALIRAVSAPLSVGEGAGLPRASAAEPEAEGEIAGDGDGGVEDLARLPRCRLRVRNKTPSVQSLCTSRPGIP